MCGVCECMFVCVVCVSVYVYGVCLLLFLRGSQVVQAGFQLELTIKLRMILNFTSSCFYLSIVGIRDKRE